jgi:hypothetical protein
VASDEAALAALCREMRLDFIDDKIRAFAVAYPAVIEQLRAQTIVHKPTECVLETVVCEAHSTTEHLRMHREIVGGELAPPSSIEPAVAGVFSSLLAPAS